MLQLATHLSILSKPWARRDLDKNSFESKDQNFSINYPNIGSSAA
jgi:hypothetical protein